MLSFVSVYVLEEKVDFYLQITLVSKTKIVIRKDSKNSICYLGLQSHIKLPAGTAHIS